MSNEPKMLILGGRRGRPKVEEPRTSVSAWVEVKHYDQLVKMANQREQSVSALVRDLIKLTVG